MDLTEHITEIQRAIRAGQFSNEAAVSRGIVMRLLQALNWPIFDTNIVCPEYRLESIIVDYALCHPPSKPAVIIEVKNIGKLEGADSKLFEYAFRAGVPMAILTDGQEWHFYLPAGKGSILERRFYKLDLLKRDVDGIVNRFDRYMLYEKIRNGEALKCARAEHDSASIVREVRTHIPMAWKKIIEEQDSILIDLISEKVADLCGYKPQPDLVSEFLLEQLTMPPQSPSVIPSFRPESIVPPPRTKGPIGYTLHGKTTHLRSAVDVLVNVLDELSKKDTNFITRLASRKHGRSRRYIAQSRDELYPGRPDLAEYSKQLSNGWWAGTNYSKSNISQIIQLACEVAGLRFGYDLIATLGD
jgi:predicted type IV restriction endonuclease